jgi:hypothetical protein
MTRVKHVPDFYISLVELNDVENDATICTNLVTCIYKRVLRTTQIKKTAFF